MWKKYRKKINYWSKSYRVCPWPGKKAGQMKKRAARRAARVVPRLPRSRPHVTRWPGAALVFALVLAASALTLDTATALAVVPCITVSCSPACINSNFECIRKCKRDSSKYPEYFFLEDSYMDIYSNVLFDSDDLL